MAPPSGRERATRLDGPLASWLVLLVPVVLVLAGAWAYRWIQEDAFINFRIIDNVLAGHGPVFNVGERVEAYSDPLWLFVVAMLHEVTPFLPIEWLSVVLGLFGTAGGVVLAGRAVQRLGGRRGEGLVLPLGLLVFASVAGVWEFATSGLEMGMVFGWMGLGFWLLVRTEERRDSARWCAVVVGLGPLIRPELALMTVVFLVALGVLVSSPGWRGPPSVRQRFVLPLVLALAPSVLYELWRMAYFALVVSNTALAKSAGSSRWSQGLTYLWNFVSPYTLWLPFVLALPLVVPRVGRWWRAHDRLGVVVLLTPVAAATVGVLYVARVGGDYQHARLVLPAFFALCIPVTAGIRQVRSLLVVPIAGIVVWSVVCAGWFRFSTGGLFLTDHGITSERSVWVQVTRNPHPVTAAEYHNAVGPYYRSFAAREKVAGHQVVLVVAYLASSSPEQSEPLLPATSPLPFALAVNVGAIGVTGYLSGPDVYVFDNFSLANPIGAHVTVAHRGRPGHEKSVDPSWMVGRFGVPGRDSASGLSPAAVAAARRALACAPLSTYLHAITAPLGASQVWSNIVHSVSYTTMQFSPTPTLAAAQLCR